MLPIDAISAAEQAAITCDVFFSVGTSAEVYPAANLPIIAKRSGAFVIEVNPRPTTISSYMDVCLEGPSGKVMPLLIEALNNYQKNNEV
jgi:NAD-dependent deacetylase